MSTQATEIATADATPEEKDLAFLEQILAEDGLAGVRAYLIYREAEIEASCQFRAAIAHLAGTHGLGDPAEDGADENDAAEFVDSLTFALADAIETILKRPALIQDIEDALRATPRGA